MPLFRRSWRWRCLACGTAGTTSNPCDVCGKPTASGADLTCDRCTSWFLDAERAWREFVELEVEVKPPRPPAPFLPPFTIETFDSPPPEPVTCRPFLNGTSTSWRALLVADGLIAP